MTTGTRETATFELVSPRTAQNWLERNGKNRRISRERVHQYAEAMKRCEWRNNGESIKFDSRGRLLDGQHRLSAIVEAGIDIPLLVVRGVDDDSFPTIDTGTKRTLGQTLLLEGYQYAPALASLANLLFVYASGESITTHTHHNPTFNQALEFIKQNPEIIDSVRVGSLSGQRIRCSGQALGFTHFLFNLIDKVDAEYFFSKLRDGDGLPEGDPILTLRNRLGREGSGPKRLLVEEQIAITIKAWNAFRRGEKIQVLGWKRGGAHPEQFPEAI